MEYTDESEPDHATTDDTAEDEDEVVKQLVEMTIKDDDEDREPPITGTAIVYDDRMTKHFCEWDPNYPECPNRLTAVWERCKQLGLVDRCIRLESRYAMDDEVLLCHSEEYLETVKSSASMSREELMSLSAKSEVVYLNQHTCECALLALGSTLQVTESILSHTVKNGFAIIRPPGHHALIDGPNGYCIFNNMAITAKYAIERANLDRILIVDWDVHHGQGVQRFFYDDPRVLYFSVHSYLHGVFWPSLRESDYDYIGVNGGKGFNVNVPLNKEGLRFTDYLAVFQQVLMPIAYEFNPQLVLVSCGLDPAIGCPEGEMSVEPSGFPHLLHMLTSLAEGRVCVMLEGGYCIKSLAEGAALVLRELLGDPCPLIGPLDKPCDSVAESILNAIKVLRSHWNSLAYQDTAEPDQKCPFNAETWPPRPGIKFATPQAEFSLYDDVYPVQKEEVKKELDEQLNVLIASTDLTVPPHRTCIVFDPELRAHKNYVNTSHPERPDRISRIYDKHIDWGLWRRCHKAKSRLATEEEIALVHSPGYIEEMRLLTDKTPRELWDIQSSMNSIYLCQTTYRCASMATGSTLNIVHEVLSGQAQNGVAIVRPPGHHAECSTAMGFCFFNSVAIAARYAHRQFSLKRILILDWDVHHGNGTQHAFDDDPSVLFISLHRFDSGYFYPFSEDGNSDKVGTGDGEGYNVNIPWSDCQMGDAEYIAAFQQVVMPIVYEYSPELVLVSAGYDAAVGDPLGGYLLSPSGFAQMTHMLSSLANGKVVLVLEGGYNLTSISECMATCTSILLGDPCPALESPVIPNWSAVQTITKVLDIQKKYWKSLKFTVPLPSGPPCNEMTEESPQRHETTATASSSDDSFKTAEDNFDPFSSPNKFESSPLFNDGIVANVNESQAVIKDYDTVNKSTDSQKTDDSTNGLAQYLSESLSASETATVKETTLKRDVQDDVYLSSSAVAPCEHSQDSIDVQDSGVVDEGQDAPGFCSPNYTGPIEPLELQTLTTCTSPVRGEEVNVMEECVTKDFDEAGSCELTGAGGTEVKEDEQGNVEEMLGAVGGTEPSTSSSQQTILQCIMQQGHDQMFAVQPLAWCPHLVTVQPLPARSLDVLDPCEDCSAVGENWVCLVCYKVLCSRYVNEHMLFHRLSDDHSVVLSYADLSVWCYTCDHYIDNEILDPAKRAANRSKFGDDSGT